MRRIVLVALLLAGLAPAARADFDTGYLAYRNAYFVEAIKQWTPLAIEGDARAQFYLGEIYSDGMGVPVSLPKAIRLYRQAARQSHAGAQARLATLYQRGRGLPRDYTQAVAWYRQAARLGDLDSQYRLGFLLEAGQGVKADLREAYRWWAIAARWGHPDAQRERDRIKGRLTAQDLARLDRQAMDWRSSSGDIFNY